MEKDRPHMHIMPEEQVITPGEMLLFRAGIIIPHDKKDFRIIVPQVGTKLSETRDEVIGYKVADHLTLEPLRTEAVRQQVTSDEYRHGHIIPDTFEEFLVAVNMPVKV
jgi:hypothetical protein